MTSINRRRGPALSLTLGLLEVISLSGLAYCALTLLGLQSCSLQQCVLVLYGAYFATSAICIVGIFRWKRWGVYGPGAATFSVAVINVIQGTAMLREFIVGMVLIAVAAALLRPAWAYRKIGAKAVLFQVNGVNQNALRPDDIVARPGWPRHGFIVPVQR